MSAAAPVASANLSDKKRLPRHAKATLAYALLILFIVIVYTNPGNLVDELGEHSSINKVVAGAALCALAGSWLLGDRPLGLGGDVGRWLLVFYGLVAASMLWSLWPAFTRDTTVDGLKYLAIFVLAANVVDGRARARQLVHVLAWASLAPAIGAMWSWAHGEHLVEGDRAGWIGTFADPNFLAFHLDVGIAMALGAREMTKRHWLRLAYLGVIGVLGVGIGLTQSRGGLLAGVVVLALWGVRSLKRRRGALGAIAVVVLLVHLAPRSLWQRAGTIENYSEDASAEGRIYAWRTGLRMVEDRPLTGVGAGAFMIAWPTYAPPEAEQPLTAHNTAVQIAAETGVPSLVVFVAALLCALMALERSARRDKSLEPVARATQIGLAAFVACSLTLGLAYSWPPYLLLGIAAGLDRGRWLGTQSRMLAKG